MLAEVQFDVTQMTAIAVPAVVSLVVIVLNIRSTRRHGIEEWQRSERLRVYSQLVGLATALSNATFDVLRALDDGEGDDEVVPRQERWFQSWRDLEPRFTDVLWLGGDEVCRAARGYFQATVDHIVPVLHPEAEVEGPRIDGIDKVWPAYWAMVDAFRRELGLDPTREMPHVGAAAARR